METGAHSHNFVHTNTLFLVCHNLRAQYKGVMAPGYRMYSFTLSYWAKWVKQQIAYKGVLEGQMILIVMF